MLMPEMGNSKMMKAATQKPTNQPVNRDNLGVLETVSTTSTEDERNAQFTRKGQPGSAGTGNRRNIIDGGVGQEIRRKPRDKQHSAHGAKELCRDIKHGVPRGDFPEAVKRERERRVHVGAGLLAPWRINQGHCRQPHGQSHQDPAYKPGTDGMRRRRVGMVKQDHEEADCNHVNAKLGCFHEVLRPMLSQELAHTNTILIDQ